MRPSGRLAAAAQRNPEAIWPLSYLRPTSNHRRLPQGPRRLLPGRLPGFNLLCRKLELSGAELDTIHDAKFKTVNRPKRHAAHLRELVAHIDTRIAEYLGRLDAEDTTLADLPGAPTHAKLQASLATLCDRRARYHNHQTGLTTGGATPLSLTNPDSRCE